MGSLDSSVGTTDNSMEEQGSIPDRGEILTQSPKQAFGVLTVSCITRNEGLFPRGQTGGSVKLTTRLNLVAPSLRMLQKYPNSPIRLHGVARNQLSTWLTSPAYSVLDKIYNISVRGGEVYSVYETLLS
jgi:hypothetical protein